MEARASPLAALGGAAAVALGALGVWLTLDGAGAAAVAISVLLVALAVLVLKPVPALSVLILTRFSFEMFWEQRVLGFSVLDFLGAGVPVAVLIAIFLGRPRLQHIPLARLLLGWAMVVVISAAIGAFAVGKPLLVVENTLRLTCGIPIFLLTVLVVRDFEAVWKLSRLWVIGALPVLGVFYVYGDRAAMEYHGVLRQKALYHDVVTPATVACFSMMICLFLIGFGRRRGWATQWQIGLGFLTIAFARMLFLTYHNAMAGTAFLGVLAFAYLRRRFGFVFLTFGILIALSQLPSVQQRWWREVAIIQGEQDPIAFASGRPNQWRMYLDRFGELEPMQQIVGVHGTWGDPENGLIQVLGDLGPFVGGATLLVLICLLWAVLRWAREEEDEERRYFLHFVAATFIGMSAMWLTTAPLTYSTFQWFCLCLLGLATATRMQAVREGAVA
jgi:hypothetical protein